MGTNYYIDEPQCDCPCDHCIVKDKLPHIGKKSVGWEFSFSAVHGPQSWKEWKALLKYKRIVSEYGKHIPFDEFVSLVERSREPGPWGSALNHMIECMKDPLSREHASRLCHLDEEGWSFCNNEFS